MTRLFGFRGRLGRSSFAALSLSVFGVVVLAVPVLVLASISQGVYGSGGLRGPGLLIPPLALFGGWSLLALVSKRLHDLGLPAWHLAWICGLPVAAGTVHALAQLAAVAGPWAWLCLARGSEEPNRFGPPEAARRS